METGSFSLSAAKCNSDDSTYSEIKASAITKISYFLCKDHSKSNLYNKYQDFDISQDSAILALEAGLQAV